MRFQTALTIARFGVRALAELVRDQVVERTEPFGRLAQRGPNCYVSHRCSLRNPERIVLGTYVNVGPDCRLWASESATLTLEDDVLLGPNVTILTSSHGYERTDVSIVRQPWEHHDVRICAGSWIGANAVILPGVTVGKGAIVAANAVVVDDIPPFTIVGGAPARILRDRRA